MIISIVTPTYDRGYLLENLFKSLLNQTSMLFEWIIVDDGSTDDTKGKVEKFRKMNPVFEIKYIYQENGGKHRAVNNGIKNAVGDYVFIVDSDDELVADAIENIICWIRDIDTIKNCAGVSGLKAKKSNGDILGNGKFAGDYIDAKQTERRKWGLLGDKAEVYRRDLLLKYTFKEFDNEKFLTEDTVWNEIAYQGYFIRWYNKVTYLCEYLDDGLTNLGDRKEIENFEGFTYAIKQRIKCNGFLDSLIARGRFLFISRKKGLTIKQAAQKLECNTYTLMVCYLLWKLKNRVIK